MSADVIQFPFRQAGVATHLLDIQSLPLEVKDAIVGAALGLSGMWGDGDLSACKEGLDKETASALEARAQSLAEQIDRAWGYALPVDS